ncbi:uncharacterized protein LOC117115784 [Anneissia japonica]|uniref:uncharacterized protein LOC117115784 n=1 Tax=Anneissia japonica TaxID=1529436 RepID=UPI001425A8DA|nr:uncharacterized protein LOC117115784 [Anneissia japonica]
MFKVIITFQWPLMIEHWNKLDEEGILEEELVRHLWRDEISKDETCFEFFLELMKQFGLLCEQIKNEESTHRSFFVPCRLKRSTDNMAIKSDSDQMVSIYMASEDFIPDSIFHPLVVSLIGMVQDMGYTAKLELFSNYANICLGCHHTLSLGPVVIDNKPSLKLEILRMSVVHEDGTTTSTGEPTPRVCMQVLEFLKQEMKVLTIGMKHTGYAFRVLCWQDSKKTHFHNLDECLEKDFIPCGQKLMMTGKLQRMFRNKKILTGNPSLPGPSVESASVSNLETAQPGPSMETSDVRNAEKAQPDGNLGYVDDMHLSAIAEGMGLEWKQLGLRLGLSWNKIQQIWSDNRRLFDRIMEMLTEWRKQQNYETNQVEIMCNALKDQGLTELANKVFGSQTSEDQSSHVEASTDHPCGRLHHTKQEHNGCLTDTDLQFIAKRLDNDWKYLGYYLNMKRSEINQIATDFSPPMVDACIEMLVKWRSRQEAKVNHLAKIIDALTSLEREDIIKELKPYYQ